MVPDTQNAVDFTHQRSQGFSIDASDIFIEQMEHIASRGVSNGGDVVFLTSVGDVWQNVTSDTDPDHVARGIEPLRGVDAEFEAFVDTTIQPDGTLNFEIPKAIEGYQLISDAGIPFGVAPGNHDYDAWWTVATPGTEPVDLQVHIGGLNNFRAAFGSGTDFFRDRDWYVSGFEGGGSSAQVFSAGGYRFLHLAFEMQAGNDVVAWARDVIDEHADLPTIISTHDYLSPQGERLPNPNMDLAVTDPEGHNSAEELWQEFISDTDQIFMILSGHQRGQALRIDRNAFGHEVYQVLADFQGRGQAAVDAGHVPGQGGSSTGDGWFREMTFRLSGANPRIDVRTYSSHYDSYSSGLDTYAEWYKAGEQPGMSDEEFLAADEFTIELGDFHTRFGTPVDR